MLTSGFLGTNQVSDTPNTSTTNAIMTTASPSALVASTTATTTGATIQANLNNNKNYNFGQKVRDTTSNKPLMAEISNCESHFRQYNKDGSVLRGIVNNRDVGLFQINEHYHLDRSKRLGYDIYSPEGNIGYAKVLFNEEGPEPWISSSPCWSKTSAYRDYVVSTQNNLVAIQ